MGSAPLKGKSSGDPSGHDDDSTTATPRSTEPCDSPGVFQAGGHGKLSKDPALEGVIRKAANDAEIVFYQTLNGDDAQLRTVPDHIRAFFPQFHGVSDKKFILLEDLTHNIKKACVMDIKMGTKTYTSDSNVLKQWMLEHKDGKTTTQALGFRVTGFRTFKRTLNDYDVKGKPWGMALRPDDVAENLVTFFDDGVTVRLDIIQKFINRLEVLLPWYSEQNMIKIYSSSLLFVYDSEGTADAADVHMIDFAHVKRIEDPEDRDHGYVSGLRNLIDIFKKIHENASGAAGTSSPSSATQKAPSSPRATGSSNGNKNPDAPITPTGSPLPMHHLELPTSTEKSKRKRAGSKSMHSSTASVEEDGNMTPDANGSGSKVASGEGESKTPKSPRSHKTSKSPRTPSSAVSDDTPTSNPIDTASDAGVAVPISKERRKSAKKKKAHREAEDGVLVGEAPPRKDEEPVEKI